MTLELILRAGTRRAGFQEEYVQKKQFMKGPPVVRNIEMFQAAAAWCGVLGNGWVGLVIRTR